jgi:hypothetical protein
MRPITKLSHYKQQRFLSRAFTGLAINGQVVLKVHRPDCNVTLEFTPEQADMWADFLKQLAGTAREQGR